MVGRLHRRLGRPIAWYLEPPITMWWKWRAYQVVLAVAPTDVAATSEGYDLISQAEIDVRAAFLVARFGLA